MTIIAVVVVIALVASAAVVLSAQSLSQPAKDEQTWTVKEISNGMWAEADLFIGLHYEYICTWDYPSGAVYLMRSADHWANWSMVDVFGAKIYGAWPGMCGYTNGSNDELIVVGGSWVAISRDNGSTFQRLSDIPFYGVGNEVGTNASWFGKTPDNDIYVAGIAGVGGSSIAFVKSSDGGSTWTNGAFPCKGTSYWPAMVSDGSRLCMVYGVLQGSTWGNEDYDLHVIYSDDWGVSWSDDEMLVDAHTGRHCVAFQMQYVGNHIAVLTFADQHFAPDSTIQEAFVNFGYLDMQKLKYDSVGRYSDGGWIGYGVAGVLQRDGTFSIAHVENVKSGGSSLFYVKSDNSGLRFFE